MSINIDIYAPSYIDLWNNYLKGRFKIFNLYHQYYSINFFNNYLKITVNVTYIFIKIINDFYVYVCS